MAEINIELGARLEPILGQLRDELTQGGSAVLVDKRYWMRLGGGWQRDLDRSIPYVQANAQALPFATQSADLVASKDVFCAEGFLTSDAELHTIIEHVGDIGTIAQEYFRVVKPGGRVVIIEAATPQEGLFAQVDQAFLTAGFTRADTDVLYEEGINDLFKPEWHRTHYTPGSFGVIYHKQ